MQQSLIVYYNVQMIPKTKIIAIPFAGGNCHSYNKFANFLPPDFELKSVEFPGRGDRMDEGDIQEITFLAKDIFEKIKKEIKENEYIIYGHSMGTLVGYELAREIVRNKYPLPSCLFFTGRAGPSIVEEDYISSYPKEAFWQEIRKLGGLPSEILFHEELLDFFEPILRADFKAVESYKYLRMIEPFNIPIHVIAGNQEANITEGNLETWQNETVFPLHKQFLVGGHFFIFEHIPKIMLQIASAHEISMSIKRPHKRG